MSSLTRRDGSPGRQLMMAILKSHWARASRSQAQAMLEFALALPVLLTLIYGLLETGRLLFIYASTVTAARQAVRYGSATGDNSGGIPFYQDCDGIRGAVHNVGFINRFENSDILITYDRGLSDVDTNGDSLVDFNDVVHIASPDPECDGGFSGFEVRTGDRIRVEVSAEWAPIVPLVPFDPFTITSQSSRTILQDVAIFVTAPASGWAGSSGGILTLDVSASPTTYDTLGQIITYTYTLTNTGTGDLTSDFGVVDVPVSSNNCTAVGPATLSVGGSFSCTGTYEITQEDLDLGFVTDTAQASANNGSVFSTLDGTTITAIQRPELTLDKVGVPDVSSVAGTEVTYTFTVENTGNVTLRPPYAILDDQTTDEACPNLPLRLAPGASLTCTGHHIITNGDINATRIINHATATARFGSTTVTSNEDTFIVYTPPVYLTLAAQPVTVTQAGQVITYRYYLYNSTDTNETGPYTVTDSRVTGVDCSGATSPLAPGATTQCIGTYTVTQADMDAAGPIVNTATATAKQGTRTLTSQVASASVAVAWTAALSLNVTAEPNEDVELGEVVTYTYLLTNTGTVTLSPPITVADNKVSGITCQNPTSPLAANGGTKTCTATRTITVEDMQNGSVISTATASAMFKTQVVASSPVTTTVLAYTGPRLSLTKSTPNEVEYFSGTPITYTYTLRNTGSVPLSGSFTVTDDKVTAVDCLLMPPTLNVGQSASCSGVHITQLPEDGPILTNIATATGYYEGSPVTSEPATESVYVSDKTCDVKHNALSITSNGLRMTVFSHNTFPVTVSSVEIIFNDSTPANQQWITRLLLGGSVIWTNTVDHISPKTASPLIGDTVIAAGGSEELAVDFQRIPYTPFSAPQKEIIRVNFATTGCGQLRSDDPGQQEPVAPTP